MYFSFRSRSSFNAGSTRKNKSSYYYFLIYDPKRREIQASYFRDRVVQHTLCDNILKPYFEDRLIYDCAACRQGKGTHFAMRRLSEFLRKFYRQHSTKGYFLKCDVRKYFDNIDHEVLKQRLVSFPDERVRDLLFMIIDSHNKDTGKGLPLGNQTSQWFSLYFPLSQGVDYLGWHFYLTDTGKVIRKLRNSNKRRFKRSLCYIEPKIHRLKTM